MNAIVAGLLVIPWVATTVAMYVAGTRGGRNPSSPHPLSVLSIFSIIGHLFGWKRLTRNEVLLACAYWGLGIAAVVLLPINGLWKVPLALVLVWVCYATLPPALTVPGFIIGLPFRLLIALTGGAEGVRERQEAARVAEKRKQQRKKERLKQRKDVYRQRQKQFAADERHGRRTSTAENDDISRTTGLRGLFRR